MLSGISHFLDLLRSPEPQDLLHGVHGVHEVNTGQGLGLQMRFSVPFPGQTELFFKEILD